jgi:hypothetical protein
VIDPHGDLVERLLASLPERRLGDVRVLDAGDFPRHVPFNPLAVQGDLERAAVVQDLGEMFYDLFDPGRTGIVGPRFEAWLRMGLLTLLEGPRASILDVPRLFLDSQFLQERFGHVQDATLIEFWVKEMAQTSDYHKSEMLGWFTSKFERFRSNPVLRHLLESGSNGLDLGRAMDEREIVLISLDKGRIGEVNARLLGYLYLASLWTAALQRPRPSPAFTVYIDEFHCFTAAAVPRMAAESRKFGLRLVLAHQHLGQLSNHTAASLAANAGNLVAFRLSTSDARELAGRTVPGFQEHQLLRLPTLEAACVTLSGGIPRPPFSLLLEHVSRRRDAAAIDAVRAWSATRLLPVATS